MTTAKMDWSDFYLICFAVGFCFSFFLSSSVARALAACTCRIFTVTRGECMCLLPPLPRVMLRRLARRTRPQWGILPRLTPQRHKAAGAVCRLLTSLR